MSLMTQTYPFSFLIDYIIVFIFCLFGAFVKDCYNTFVGVEEKVKLVRIFISSTVSSVIIFGGSDYILGVVSWKVMFLLCFIGGMLGFEIMGKIQNVKFWLTAFEHRGDIIDMIHELNNQNSPSQDSNSIEAKDDEDGN